MTGRQREPGPPSTHGDGIAPTVLSPLPAAAQGPQDGCILNAVLGPYRLRSLLGQGGMAMVYEASSPTGLLVALKVLQESPFLPAGMLERFHREAEAAKRLGSHPNIVTVHETGQAGRDHYIAMELVPGGQTLACRIRRGPLPVAEALQLAIKIAGALEFAHRQGIVHRDIKPGNILLSAAGEPLLSDFGLARIEMDPSRSLTVSSLTGGTPRYMAPEQAASLRAASHLSDQYSFGVLLYEMLTGQPPYRIDSGMGIEAIIRTIRQQPPTPPRRHRRGLSRSLCAVLSKLLEKEPADRYPSMAAVMADLTACLSFSRVQAAAPSVGRRLDRLLARHRGRAVLALSVLLLFAGLFCWHRESLAAARRRALLPKAEAASHALALDRLRHELGGAPEGADEGAIWAEVAASLMHAGGVAAALQRLDAAIEAETNPERLRSLMRSAARCRLAGGDYDAAVGAFSMLRDQAARQREIQRLRDQDPSRRDARHGGACFDQALALELAGDRDGAAAFWEHALHDLPHGSPEQYLSGAALDAVLDPRFAEWAAQQRPAHAAVGYCLIGLRSAAPDLRSSSFAAARMLAKSHLPWLYYYLAYGPGAQELAGRDVRMEVQP